MQSKRTARLKRLWSVIAAVCGLSLVGCGHLSTNEPLLDAASGVRRSASQLLSEQRGATATVRQRIEITGDRAVFLVVPPDGVDIDAVRLVDPSLTEALARGQTDWQGRPTIAIVSAERAESTPIEGVIVPKQFIVAKARGEHDIAILLRREADGVTVDDLK